MDDNIVSTCVVHTTVSPCKNGVFFTFEQKCNYGHSVPYRTLVEGALMQKECMYDRVRLKGPCLCGQSTKCRLSSIIGQIMLCSHVTYCTVLTQNASLPYMYRSIVALAEQWNLSIVDTTGTQLVVLYREVQTVSSLERCPLFRVSFIERLHCSLATSISHALMRDVVQYYSKRKVLYR